MKSYRKTFTIIHHQNLVFKVLRVILLFALTILLSFQVTAQEEKSEKAKMSMKTFKDSLDGALDMSDFLISYHGFIPVPQLITEPALGNIGFMFTPIFIHPNKYQKESPNYVPPDITAAAIGYTANKSWFVGGMRMASLPKYKLRYRVGIGYGDMNMDFYRNIPVLGETKFGFNFKAAGIFGSLLREIGNSDLYLGVQYYYAKNDVSLQSDDIELPSFVEDKDLASNLGSFGLEAQFDKRDNVFTPNKGWYITGTYKFNANWTGSDYDFENLNVLILKFFQTTKKWVSGFRLEGSAQFGDAPFYLKPQVNMRGVPMSRYQGDESYVLETEQRFDFTSRWSAIAFVGMAKTPTQNVNFKNSLLIYNYGAGFRYLIARKFGLRTGVDVAWSNDDFGWYIVFGHAWNNRN